MTVELVLAIVLATLFVLLVFAQIDYKPAPPPSQKTGWLPAQRLPALSGEVVHAAYLGRLDLGLDCLVAPGLQESPLDPVSIEATSPFLCGLGTLYAADIPRRVAEGRQVLIEIMGGADRAARARLKMGDAMMLLALHPNQDLLRHLRALRDRANEN